MWAVLSWRAAPIYAGNTEEHRMTPYRELSLGWLSTLDLLGTRSPHNRVAKEGRLTLLVRMDWPVPQVLEYQQPQVP
jgi:hypothetical protein